jgi:phosphatidate cytidylyltransferase
VGVSLTTDTPTRDPTIVTTPSPGTRQFDLQRVYTAVALIPVVYVIIRHLPPWALTLLLMAGGFLALIELYCISLQSRPNHLLIGVGLAVSALVLARHHLPLALTDLWAVATLAIPVAMLLSSGPFKNRLKDAAIIAFGVCYVGFTLSTVASTRLLPDGERFVLFLALVTWAGDTGAYYAGTLWGKHLLAPSVSPKKTVEGAVGGVALAVGAALSAHAWFVPRLSLSDTLVLGLFLAGSGLLGDLWESAIKRRVGVKDSGSILPGHGGMLDRLDSLLFTAPTFYYYVTWIRGISPSP